MAVVEWKKDGTVAIMTMNEPENRHNPSFASGMLQAFDEIEADEEIKSIVLASSDKKNWSLGIDLKWMMEQVGKNDTQAIKDFMYLLNKLFKRILTIPMPVIAAINGHAFGDGPSWSAPAISGSCGATGGSSASRRWTSISPSFPACSPDEKGHAVLQAGRAGVLRQEGRGKELEECHMVMKAM